MAPIGKSVALIKGDQMYHFPRIPFKKLLWILRTGKVRLKRDEHINAIGVFYKTGGIKGCATFICRDEIDTAAIFLPESKPAITQNETLF